jgi:membrane protease YdiL (CAAX protease family)
MMILPKRRQTPAVPYIFVIVFTALLVQLVGHYHAGALVIGRNFYLSWLLLRIALPVLALIAMRIPLSRIGLGRPKIDRRTGGIIILIVVLLFVVFAWIYFFESYFNSYSASFQGEGRLDRFISFMLFTGSTLTGWEFLHRGFLLMGVLYILTERERLSAPTASFIALALVWAFEVLFHFIKPELEALGMLVGSPVLSWLALRTRSIWVPFLIHLLVELLFIASLLMR